MEYTFTYDELKKNGWDGNPNSLDEFKKKLKLALEQGWDPNEMTLQEFLDEEEIEEDLDDIEDEDYESRRLKAELAGWDENEMDLEEFEDYFMK